MESSKEVRLVYSAALKEMEIRLEILNDEFQHVHKYNPIEHIKSRIKTPESIENKLKKHGFEPTVENMVRHINDIAGIRVICSFTTDVYRIAHMLEQHKDLNILYVRDYIKTPKRSGYKSYHMLVLIPVYLSEKKVEAKVEIQIRTVAMDFWASLEHKINYKFDAHVPPHIKEELLECAKMVSELDEKMLSLNEEVKAGLK